MPQPSTTIVALAVLLAAPVVATADHFDDHSLQVLQSVDKRTDVRKAPRVSLTELAALPKVVQGDPQSVLLVVHTDERNWSKLLVRAGGIRRKGAAEPRPFLHIERLITYSADPKRGVLADKRDIYLFDGLALDLDLGQVVKKGDGGDLIFESTGPAAKAGAKEAMMEGDSPRLGPLQGTATAGAETQVFIPSTALIAASKSSARTKSSGAITPDDFAGRYRLDVDGRFTGVLRLRVEGGRLRGTFASDQTGASYEVLGAPGAPAQRLELTISFPRTDLKLDGRLFTRSRARIAGSALMEENTFGFVAERAD